MTRTVVDLAGMPWSVTVTWEETRQSLREVDASCTMSEIPSNDSKEQVGFSPQLARSLAMMGEMHRMHFTFFGM